MAEKISINYLRGLNPASGAAIAVAAVVNQLIDDIEALRQEIETLKANSLTFTPNNKKTPRE